MRSIESTLCSTQCDRVEIDGLLIVDSYKYTWISNKAYKDLSATLLPSASVSNPGYSGLSHGEYTRILVSDRVNQDLQATLYTSASVRTHGIEACHLKCIPESQSETKYQGSILALANLLNAG